MTCRCPVCGSTDTEDQGAPVYRQPTLVAGVPIDVSDLQLSHRRCRDCTFRFIDPPPPESRLLACYRDASDQHWSQSSERGRIRDHDRKRSLLAELAPGRAVLDVGCFTGDFLAGLSSEWRRFGTEPSASAADLARAKGIAILGPTPDAIAPKRDERFDAIVLLDVIEHVIDPLALLHTLRQLLSPVGLVLIETADTDSWHFRRAGKLDPYCGLVEHVSFFNKSSIERVAARAGFTVTRFEQSVHSRGGPVDMVTDAGRVATFWALRAARRWFRLPGRAGAVAAGPIPRSLARRDHFIACLRPQASLRDAN